MAEIIDYRWDRYTAEEHADTVDVLAQIALHSDKINVRKNFFAHCCSFYE